MEQEINNIADQRQKLFKEFIQQTQDIVQQASDVTKFVELQKKIQKNEFYENWTDKHKLEKDKADLMQKVRKEW